MTIICLIGPSGSGKTTLAEAMATSTKTTAQSGPHSPSNTPSTGEGWGGLIPTIRSYTTRPMRPGEQNGREHIFITEAEADYLLTTQRTLAFTHFGGYRYFALWGQLLAAHQASPTRQSSPLKGDREGLPIITYVIDEAGYHSLLTQIIERQCEMRVRYGIELPTIHLLPIRIERSEADLAATIDPARRARDEQRTGLDATIPYRIIIHNDAPTATALTEWARHQFAPALRLWLERTATEATSEPSGTGATISTRMTIAQIIAHLNGAI